MSLSHEHNNGQPGRGIECERTCFCSLEAPPSDRLLEEADPEAWKRLTCSGFREHNLRVKSFSRMSSLILNQYYILINSFNSEWRTEVKQVIFIVILGLSDDCFPLVVIVSFLHFPFSGSFSCVFFASPKNHDYWSLSSWDDSDEQFVWFMMRQLITYHLGCWES